jgi:hypothetical protein
MLAAKQARARRFAEGEERWRLAEIQGELFLAIVPVIDLVEIEPSDSGAVTVAGERSAAAHAGER